MADEFLPCTFVDDEKNEWRIRFDGLSMTQIREQLNINICDAKADMEAFVKTLEMPKVLAMVWIACEKQAIKRSISWEDFLSAMSGDVLDAIPAAFFGALANFSLPAQLRPAALTRFNRSMGLLMREQQRQIQEAEKVLASETDEDLLKMLLAQNYTMNTSNSADSSGPIPTEGLIEKLIE
jgi:hypothetical protein